MGATHYSMEYGSPVGMLTLVSDGAALTGCYLAGQRYFAAGLGALVPGTDAALLAGAQWLDAYFAGKHPAPDALPLRLSGSRSCGSLCASPTGMP